MAPPCACRKQHAKHVLMLMFAAARSVSHIVLSVHAELSEMQNMSAAHVIKFTCRLVTDCVFSACRVPSKARCETCLSPMSPISPTAISQRLAMIFKPGKKMNS